MHLSYEQFADLCRGFQVRHEQFGWRLMEHHDDLTGQCVVYLHKSYPRLVKPAMGPSLGPPAALLLTDPDGEDPDSLPLADQPEVHMYECHVVFSESYRVPVLYFRAWADDGGYMLSADQVMEHIPLELVSGLDQQMRGSFITQVEHPLLQKPFYCIHPCRTAEVLDTCSVARERMLVGVGSLTAASRAAVSIGNLDLVPDPTAQPSCGPCLEPQPRDCCRPNEQVVPCISPDPNADSGFGHAVGASILPDQGSKPVLTPPAGCTLLESWLSLYGPVIGLHLDIWTIAGKLSNQGLG
mmetsp:Transcript_127935/g.221067  ORF Transcript_127935/g.221067 Transcript_127935/m.221067 type:complete len:297 (-) Transcript_127935:1560-2450(-)